MTSSAAPSRRLGVIGSIAGCLALIAAILPHWVLPVVFPPPPVDQVIVDTGQRVKDRIVARIKKVEYQAPQREKSVGARFSEGFSIAALSLALLAITLAVFSLIFREEKLLAGVSVTLGFVAIAVEISFFVIGVLLLIAIIYAVMSFIGLF